MADASVSDAGRPFPLFKKLASEQDGSG